MKPSDYVFLESREARMLAASWPEMFAEARGDAENASNDVEKWRRIAGIEARMMRTTELIAAANGLRWNGICLDDGTLDPDAAAFIKRAAYAAAGVEMDDRVMTLISPGYAMGGRVDPSSMQLGPLPAKPAPKITINANPMIEAELAATTRKLREAEAERDRYRNQVKVAADERDAARAVVEEIVDLVEIDPRDGGKRREEWLRRAGSRPMHHIGEVGPSIPHAPFDPSGHASGCTAFACVSHCRQPRKTASPEAGC